MEAGCQWYIRKINREDNLAGFFERIDHLNQVTQLQISWIWSIFIFEPCPSQLLITQEEIAKDNNNTGSSLLPTAVRTSNSIAK